MSVTRREFISTAAATVAAVGTGAGAAPPVAAAHKIRRGVATYSYQEEFLVRQMSVEDCLREMSDIGANGLEFLAEMMVPGFPDPTETWVEQWRGWLEKYRIVPAAYTQFVDTMRTRSHNLTVEEG